jgi:GDP-4-dehydro-6-deoxy-D-mannose reductase
MLVSGAGGFIGSALVVRLQALGHNVIALDTRDGDIAEWQTLARFEQEEFRHVFHLAGKTFVPDSWENPQAFCRTNVQGTINVLELCRKKRLPLTYVSAYVYGHPERLPIAENSPVKPSNPYALTKRLAEEACEFYAQAYDLPVTMLRPFNVYGIGQAENFLIPTIINQALHAEKIVVKDLSPKRDYVHLDDLLSALLATLGGPQGCHVYNVGAGHSLSVAEVIDIVQEAAGTDKEIISDNVVRPNELMDVVADISKTEIELGWRPQISFRAGIESIIRSEREKRKYEYT